MSQEVTLSKYREGSMQGTTPYNNRPQCKSFRVHLLRQSWRRSGEAGGAYCVAFLL